MGRLVEGRSPRLPPKRGDIAICSIGHVGLITSETAETITYADGNVGEAWLGIKLVPEAGTEWSSRQPTVIARPNQEGGYAPAESCSAEQDPRS
jgi:hypothetical protein